MKKYLVIAIIVLGGISVSCSADDKEELIAPTINSEHYTFDTSIIQKELDSIGIGDTGGQGGNNPIKP